MLLLAAGRDFRNRTYLHGCGYECLTPQHLTYPPFVGNRSTSTYTVKTKICSCWVMSTSVQIFASTASTERTENLDNRYEQARVFPAKDASIRGLLYAYANTQSYLEILEQPWNHIT